MADRIYLDYNGFQRGFDDQSQTRIRIETEACEKLFTDAEHGKAELVWSFMHDDENRVCPFADRLAEVSRLGKLCKTRVGPKDSIRRKAKSFEKDLSVKAKDALHLAAARAGKAKAFLTCDDELLKKTKDRIPGMAVMNPVDYILHERKDDGKIRSQR